MKGLYTVKQPVFWSDLVTGMIGFFYDIFSKTQSIKGWTINDNESE